MSKDNYQEYVDLAEHYLAIGMDSISLFDWSDDPISDKPWEYVTQVNLEGYDNMKFGTANVYCSFTAPHPCGLTFTWRIRPFKDSVSSDDPYPYVNKDALILMQQKLAKPLWWAIQAGLRAVATSMNKHIDDHLKAVHNWQNAQQTIMSFVLEVK